MWKYALLTPVDVPLQEVTKASFTLQPNDVRIGLPMPHLLIKNRIWGNVHRCQFKQLSLIPVVSVPIHNCLFPENQRSTKKKGCQVRHQGVTLAFPTCQHEEDKCPIIKKQSNTSLKNTRLPDFTFLYFLRFSFKQLQHYTFLLLYHIASSPFPSW